MKFEPINPQPPVTIRQFMEDLLGNIGRDASQGDESVPLIQTNNADPLRVAADLADVAGVNPLDLAAGGNHDHFVVILDGDDVDHLAVALGRANVPQSLSAAPLTAIALVARISGRSFFPFAEFPFAEFAFTGGR